MNLLDKRLAILSEAEKSALYELPDFDDDQRLEYLTLTAQEQELLLKQSCLETKVYCALQIGYFKAKKMFFRFAWSEPATEDITFILQEYFSDETFKERVILKHEHYTQRQDIASFFNYRLWSKTFETIVYDEAGQIILRDTNPQFIMMQLLAFLQEKRIVRPRYTTFQIMISNTLNKERKRLVSLINKLLPENEVTLLKQLLQEEDVFSRLAAIKQDAKNFKARMMASERSKLLKIKPLYQRAKILLPELHISKQNIHYYGGLIHYYTAHDLRERLQAEQTYLYMLCYIWLRYQQFNENLIDAFCYHLKQFEDKTKTAAKESFYQYQKQEQNEQLLIRRFAKLFIEERLSDDICFGEVRKQAFTEIMPKDELHEKLFSSNKKSTKELDFRWENISKIGGQFKNQLRPLAMILDFESILPNSPWLSAIAWMKLIFKNLKSLKQQPATACPEGTIPKRLVSHLTEISQDGKTSTINANRYEFWIYRQLKKRIQSGELYLTDSINHGALQHELVSLKDKDAILKQLDIPALRQPIEKRLDEKYAELHALWVSFNDDLKNGQLKHLRYDETTKTLHLRKAKDNKDEELKNRFYKPLPLCDIADVFRFVNEQCSYLFAFTHILHRYTKLPIDEDSVIAVIMAQALNHGNLNMAKVCDISYHILQDTYQSRIRLATLKAACDILSNAISRLPIFPHYSIDLILLYSALDGQKFQVERPTTKARNSKKYFKKGKGVVAYTLLANHIPLQTELIGAHEHESYFVFDIWYNNITEVTPDVVTGDMHCINKGNFAIMDWFGGRLFPRFTDIEAQLKHLYCGRDPNEYKDFLIQPVGQLDRSLIENDWPNQQRIIATLGLKEMKQSTLIKKLCTYTSGNPMRKALFEYDKLIRSIHTLKYLRDPTIQKNTHRSQNTLEAYHQLRSTMAQVNGKKELYGKTDIAVEISNQCGRLTAIVIHYYNSMILSKVLEKYEVSGNKKGIARLKKISPIAWGHLHFQGHFKFSDKSNMINLDAIVDKLALES